MAITFERPLKEWYYESTSKWTLDYMPFFAFFEWLLAQPAALYDREIVRVENLEYLKVEVIYYQRFTVILSDIFFLYGCVRYFQAEAANRKTDNKRIDITRLAFNYGSAALLLLDNIHF